jgi:hypothetical protein
VVYGRNAAARVAVFTFLRSIGLTPMEWSQAVAATGQGSPYIGEVIGDFTCPQQPISARAAQRPADAGS